MIEIWKYEDNFGRGELDGRGVDPAMHECDAECRPKVFGCNRVDGQDPETVPMVSIDLGGGRHSVLAGSLRDLWAKIGEAIGEGS